MRVLWHLLPGLVVATAAAAAFAQGQVDVLCSVPIGWCEAVAGAFLKEAGVTVNLTVKSAAEGLAQITAERTDPKHDVWFGGASHLRASELGLTDEYRSPHAGELHDWAVRRAEASNWHAVGIYAAVLGIGYNADVLIKRGLPEPKCWADLARPDYRDQLQMPNPNTTDAGYAVVATLVQIFGEERAFELLKGIHRNTKAYARTGGGPVRAAARREIAVAVTFLHEASAEAVAGFPIRLVMPCEGTGYEIGSMSIVKGARHLADARRFYDWALTPGAQKLAADTRNLVTPSNAATPVPESVPKMSELRLIAFDFTKYGEATERRRLLERWGREVFASPR